MHAHTKYVPLSRAQVLPVQQGMQLDAHVYGTLVAACAEAMQRELSVAHERKDQYVLLERALNLVDQAEAAGIALGPSVYNALLVRGHLHACTVLARAWT